MSAELKAYRPDDDYPDALTMPDVVALFVAHLDGRVAKADFSPKFRDNARFYLERFAAEIPKIVNDRRKTPGAVVLADEVRQQDFVAWMDSHPTWRSAHTKKGAQSHVVSCFQWAADAERGNLLDRCHLKRIKAVSNLPYVPRRRATPHEIFTLMRNGSRELKQGLFWVYVSGCRPCEMRELVWPWVRIDWSSINWAVPFKNLDLCLDRNPHLCLEKHKGVKKSGKPKIMGLDDVSVRFLIYLRRHNMEEIAAGRRDKNCQHVFRNCDGGPWAAGTFGQNLRRCAARSGLDEGVEKKVSAGCLRTTFACDLIELEGDDALTNRQIADLLGHTTTAMVDKVYGAATRDDARHLGNMAKKAKKRRKKR